MDSDCGETVEAPSDSNETPKKSSDSNETPKAPDDGNNTGVNLESCLSHFSNYIGDRCTMIMHIITKTLLSPAAAMSLDVVKKFEKYEELRITFHESTKFVSQSFDKIELAISFLMAPQFRAQVAKLRSKRSDSDLDSVKITLSCTKRSLADVNELYETAKEKCNGLRKDCTSEKADCEKKTNQAKGNVIKARFIEGAIAIGGIAVVVGSLYASAGLMTFSLLVTGTTVVVSCDVAARQFEKAEENYRKLRQKFKKLRTSSIKSCECIHTWLVKLQGEIQALECYAENHNTMNHFAFDRLQKVATEISGKISTFRNELPS